MKHLVAKQIEGLPLCDKTTTKIEYQLRAKGSGRIVLAYQDVDKAKREADMRNLHCFRVTTISEMI